MNKTQACTPAKCPTCPPPRCLAPLAEEPMYPQFRVFARILTPKEIAKDYINTRRKYFSHREWFIYWLRKLWRLP